MEGLEMGLERTGVVLQDREPGQSPWSAAHSW